MTADTDEIKLADFIAQHGIELVIASSPKTTTKDADGWEHYAWHVSLMRGNEGLATPYRRGTAHATQKWNSARQTYDMKPTPPTTDEVLDSLHLDAQCYDDARDFEDFALSLGYDTDSRKAEAMYRECGEVAKRLRFFLGNEAYAQLLERVERL